MRTPDRWMAACGLVGVLLAGAVPATAADDGRLIASNCFQCHGTGGRGGRFDSLAGESKAEILDELREMRRENPRADIMNAHARGYTTAQLDALATYFSRLPKR